MTRHERIRGVVKGPTGVPVAGRCRLTVDTQFEGHALDGDFELEEPDGQISRVQISASAVLGERTKTMRYEQALAEPGVSEVSLKPGPHVKVTLVQAWLLGGDEIELAGERTGQVFADGGDYREAAPVKGSTIRAYAAGSPGGVDAWEAAERKKSGPPVEKQGLSPMFLPTLMFAVAGGLAVASIAMAPSLFSYVAPALAICLGAAGLGFAWSALRIPNFRGGRSGGVMISVLALGIGAGGMMPPLGPITTGGTGALVLTVVIAAWMKQRGMRSHLAMLSRAAREPRAREHGTFTGIVEDPTPVGVAGVPSAVGRVTNVTGSGEDASIAVDDHGLDSTFVVHLHTGARVTVDPKNALWSSSVVTKAERRGDRTVWAELVPIGSEIIVAGTPTPRGDSLVVESTGPESLIFFATKPGEDPYAMIARMQRGARRVYLGAFALVVIAAALTVHGVLVPS